MRVFHGTSRKIALIDLPRGECAMVKVGHVYEVAMRVAPPPQCVGPKIEVWLVSLSSGVIYDMTDRHSDSVEPVHVEARTIMRCES